MHLLPPFVSLPPTKASALLPALSCSAYLGRALFGVKLWSENNEFFQKVTFSRICHINGFLYVCCRWQGAEASSSCRCWVSIYVRHIMQRGIDRQRRSRLECVATEGILTTALFLDLLAWLPNYSAWLLCCCNTAAAATLLQYWLSSAVSSMQQQSRGRERQQQTSLISFYSQNCYYRRYENIFY